MNITTHIDSKRRRIAIRVAGRVGAESAYGILHHTIVEAYGNDCRELILDLRQADFVPSAALFRLHSLLQMFKTVILHKEVQITILFSTDKAEQWMHLDKAVDFAGINVRFFTNQMAARHFLGTKEELFAAVR